MSMLDLANPFHDRFGTRTKPETDANPTRRTFLMLSAGTLAAGYGALLGYPVYRYLASPVEKAAEIGMVTQVILPEALSLPAGSALMFRFGARAAILIHHLDGTWTSFSAVCTHLGCTVQYEPGKERIYCACHGGVYDPTTGQAMAGPPPRGLPVYRVEINDGQLSVHRT